MCGKMVRNFLGPVLGNLVTELSNLKFSGFSTFVESPFITKWSLDLQMDPRIFPKSQGLLVEGAFGGNPFLK